MAGDARRARCKDPVQSRNASAAGRSGETDAATRAELAGIRRRRSAVGVDVAWRGSMHAGDPQVAAVAACRARMRRSCAVSVRVAAFTVISQPSATAVPTNANRLRDQCARGAISSCADRRRGRRRPPLATLANRHRAIEMPLLRRSASPSRRAIGVPGAARSAAGSRRPRVAAGVLGPRRRRGEGRRTRRRVGVRRRGGSATPWAGVGAVSRVPRRPRRHARAA